MYICKELGVVASENLEFGEYVVEYVGELINLKKSWREKKSLLC